DNGDEYRLLSDPDADGAAASASASASFADERADDAGAAADRAESAASSYAEIGTNFKTVPVLIADETMGYAGSGRAVSVGAGDVVSADGVRYGVAPTGSPDEHVETAGGVALYLRRNAELTVYSEQAGITAATTSAADINKMLADALAAGARTVKM